jgi:hypothetical protein
MIALVLGGAESLWDDVERFRRLHGFDFSGWCSDPQQRGLIVATNAAGVHYPGPVDHWVTRHAPYFLALPKGRPGWFAQRDALHAGPPAITWSIEQLPAGGLQVDHIIEPWGATSGLLALQVALDELNCDGAVGCGIPMDTRPHFDRPGEWASALTFQTDWLLHMERIGDRFRSMSGWTRDLHGEPTADWIRERMAS